jgi:23S rRNA (uridine2552-2'-O)-methyltransferase
VSNKFTSRQWLKEHESCPYVQKARAEGYRSRAVYKLTELQEKFNIISPDDKVLELGAAPGGWSRYVASIVKKNGRIIALDLLEFEPIPFVEQVIGDFTLEDTHNKLNQTMNQEKFNVILSDMLPNATGHSTVDHLKSSTLVEEVIWFAKNKLEIGGNLLVKIIQGNELLGIIKDLRKSFLTVKQVKPKASRARSNETFIYAKHLKGE